MARVTRGLYFTRNDLRRATEYMVVRKHPSTPVNLLVVLGLRRNRERDNSRSLILSPEPTVSNYSPLVFPFIKAFGKFNMFGHALDVRVLIGPHFAIAGGS